MNALVGYGSSDEEEDVLPQRPAKVAKLDDNAPEHLTAPLKSELTQTILQQLKTKHKTAPTAHPEAQIQVQPLKASTIDPPPPQDVPQGPSAGPTIPAPHPPNLDETAATATAPSNDTDTPFSPYAFTRQRLRELTMPPVPNFDIPDAPPPPAQNSEEAATLAAVTKQFERFLELKKQGIHFNERLQSSTSLRNPSLLPKLMAFAGIGQEDCYESTLSAEFAVPARWPEDCYVESLVRVNERREKKRAAERERVDFVPARAGEGSGRTTPNEGKRSKFDKR